MSISFQQIHPISIDAAFQRQAMILHAGDAKIVGNAAHRNDQIIIADAVAADPAVFHAALARWGLLPDPLTADLVSTARTGPDRL